MQFVILCACVALAVAQSPSSFPAQPRVFPEYGPQQYGGYSQYPIPYQPHVVPKVVSPSSVPVYKPVEPQVQHVQPTGFVPQQYNVHHHQQQFIPILKQSQDIQVDSGYQWDFQSANGINSYESAIIVPRNADEATKSVQGGFSYTSPEGIPVEVTYTADENGFHPHVVVHTHGAGERHHHH